MLSRDPSRLSFLAWFLMGAMCVAALQWSQSQATGDVGGLIKVGRDHPLSDVIQSQVPGIPVAPGLGHDGQIYYSIGLDLTGREMAEQMRPTESAAYRYRRIGYPAVSSVLGLLEGRGLLWGMVVVNAASAGLAAAAAAAIAQHFRRTPLAALAVVLNPGVWLSALLLTVDNLALAAGLLAILAFLKGRLGWAVIALAGAVLTKEVSFAFAVGLAGFAAWKQRDRRAAGLLVVGSLAPFLVWLLFIETNIGNVFDSAGNIGIPLAGMVEAIRAWPGETLRDNLFGAITLFFVAVAAVGLRGRRPLWRWLAWPWVGIALLSSHLVWTLGNNAIRVFAPLAALTVLGLLDRDDVSEESELPDRDQAPGHPVSESADHLP